MAGAKQSKNSRTISGQKKAIIVGDIKFIVPCNGGKNAYVRNVEAGTNPFVATNSEAFVNVIRANVEAGYGEKMRAEIETLVATYPDSAWGAALELLVQAGAFDAPEAA